MWHEARRMEKAIRKGMQDTCKKNERRKNFYESIRADPDQFMQVHGRASIIHTDKAIARAAEDANVLRPWQGDKEVMIDRFDARSHLEFIPPARKEKARTDSDEDKMEILCDFERYRILVINEYRKVGEKEYLHKIAEKEFWYSAKSGSNKAELEKKKRAAENKAAIGFSYDGSETVRGSTTAVDDLDSDSDDEMDEPEDIDAELDVSCLDAESTRRANRVGEGFGVRRGAFCQLQSADHKAMLDHTELKQIEKEKLALAGKASKHERVRLKQRRQLIVGRGCNDDATTSLLSLIAAKDSKGDGIDDSSSSSEDSDANIGKTVYIRSIGGGKQEEAEEEDDEKEGVSLHGPALPSEQVRRIFELKSRGESPPLPGGDTRRGEIGQQRSRSPYSRRRVRSRSRSRGRRSRSRERYHRRSRSRSPRRRSRSRERERRRESEREGRDRERERERERDRRRHHDHSSSLRNSSNAKNRSRSLSSREEDAQSQLVRSASSESEAEQSMLSLHSSMSEEEKERRQIENRKRRIKKTKKLIREKAVANGARDESESEDDNRKSHAQKIRERMQKTLKKRVGEMKAEEAEKEAEAAKERREREIALYSEECLRRERERRARREERERQRQLQKQQKQHRHSRRRRHSSSSH